MANKDLYSILGVSKGAEASEVKKAYRALARKLHPDTNPGDKAAEDRFKEVSAAWTVLGDEKKRKLYDDFGADGLRDGFDADAARNYQRWAGPGGGGGFGGFNMGGGGLGGFGDLDDILGGFFGGGGRMRPPRRKGENLETEATISLRQAIEGTEIELMGQKGKVRIPKGIADGQRLRLKGRGAHGHGGRGDLLLTVQIASPPGFLAEGDHLTLDLPLTVGQAVFGATVEVPTPAGKNLRLKMPAGTQSGRRLRLRGKGMTIKGGGRGNLYVRAQIRVPIGDSEALRAAVAALDACYSTTAPEPAESEMNAENMENMEETTG